MKEAKNHANRRRQDGIIVSVESVDRGNHGRTPNAGIPGQDSRFTCNV